MKSKRLGLKVICLFLLALNYSGIFNYDFSNKWVFLYDNTVYITFAFGLLGVCILGMGLDKERDKWFLLTGLIASLPLVFFTAVYTVNTFRHGLSTVLFLSTIVWMLLFIYLYKNNQEIINT
ncbi:MAG: hypothetical protein GX914_01175 [Erysipelotrichia bacterium]|nr:hypothetical protein [Erysipelotrichia bacterium]